MRDRTRRLIYPASPQTASSLAWSPTFLSHVGELLALAPTRRLIHPRSLQTFSSSVWSPTVHPCKLECRPRCSYSATGNQSLPRSLHQGDGHLNYTVGAFPAQTVTLSS